MIIQAPAFMRGRNSGPPSSLLTGFVGGWNLNGNGSDVLGVSPATAINTPVFVTGKGGQQALQTAGLDPSGEGYFQIAATPQVRPTGAITAAMWVRFTSYPPSNVRVFTDYDQSPASTRWILGYSNGAYFYVVLYRPGVGDVILPIESLTVMGLNVWHLVGLSWSGATVKTWLNGVEKSTFAYAGTLNSGSPSNPLSIGTQFNAGQGNFGQQQNCYLWNRELTNAEWVQFYKRSSPNRYPFTTFTPNELETGLAAYWSLNGTGQGEFGNGGQIDGTVTFEPGLFGELAADFTEPLSGPSINCGLMAPFGTGDFTMACWATLDDPLPFYARWFCLSDNGPSFFCDPAGVAGLAYGNTVAANLGHTVTVGAPTHYAVSVSQSGGSTTIRPYINAVATTPTTIATPAWDTATVGTIGSRYGRTERFPGRVQRAAYWRRALSAGQILDVYNGATYPFA